MAVTGKILCLLVVLLVSAHADQCLNPNGTAVNWWVQMVFPGAVTGGFGYIDSTYAAPSFVVHAEAADSANTPMTRTLSQINTMKLEAVAWNDEQPNGNTSSSKAHSKGVIAYYQKTSKGFFIVHSIPKFPAFTGWTVNTTIDSSETIYGQHVFCLSIDNVTVYDLITKILPIKPYIYAQNLNNANEINNLMTAGTIKQPDYTSTFTYRNYTVNSTNMLFIFKNGGVNASIFEDGMNNLLKSPLLAETWGRPLQDPWCGSTYGVGNIQTVKFSSTAFWNETQDHSKWAYATANNYSCFGDMNRMTSQWVRGGAFYCLKSSILKQALVSITASTTPC